MRSLTIKLMLAFLIISLVQAGLVAFFAREAAEREFDQFIREQALAHFIDNVSAHYRALGSWAGVARSVREAAEPLRRPSPQGGSADRLPPAAPSETRPARQIQPFALADQNGIVVVPAGRYRPDQRVATHELAGGMPVTVAGTVVGTVVRTEESQQLSARELRYLERTLQAILYAAGIGLVIALVLGVVLARGYTQPLRQLTAAARALARGELGQQVAVRTRDELGTLTKAFNQMSADLEEAATLRRRMTADIAHDLRTPLTVLTGYLEALRDGALPPSRERFDMMYAEAQHLGRLVQDLRTLSLADAGELSLQPQAVDPSVLLERIRARFAQQAQEKNVKLTVHAEASLPDLWIDPDRMVQVLANLVDNALRYTPEDGQITLSAEARRAQLALQVIDTGSGIPADALPYLFNRFYRVDASRHQQQGETGLGLAIARSIVEAHGGTINVDSEPGRGTTFTIVLTSVAA